MDAGTKMRFWPSSLGPEKVLEKAGKGRDGDRFFLPLGFSQQHLQEGRGRPRDKERAALPLSRAVPGEARSQL